MMSRYFVEWLSERLIDDERARAIARGVDVDAHDDWWEPSDVALSRDFDDYRQAWNFAERIVSVDGDAAYGSAQIFKRCGDSSELFDEVSA
jgi:hypothetical protein